VVKSARSCRQKRARGGHKRARESHKRASSARWLLDERLLPSALRMVLLEARAGGERKRVSESGILRLRPLSTSPCPACLLLRRACTHAHVRLHRTEQGQPQPAQQIAAEKRRGDGGPQPVAPSPLAAGPQRNVHGPMAGGFAEQCFNSGKQEDGSFVCHLCSAPAAHISLKQFEQLHWWPHLRVWTVQQRTGAGSGPASAVQAPCMRAQAPCKRALRAFARRSVCTPLPAGKPACPLLRLPERHDLRSPHLASRWLEALRDSLTRAHAEAPEAM